MPMYGMTEPTKLSLSSHGKTYTAELPWDATFSDILNALVGLGVAATYSHKGMLESMQEFATEELEGLFPDDKLLEGLEDDFDEIMSMNVDNEPTDEEHYKPKFDKD